MINKKQSYKQQQFQQGLSLIELMISMVVGLFLLAGVVTNFISTNENDRMRNAVSEVDANAASALRELRNTITHTGYATTNNVRFYNDKVFFTLGDSNLPTSSDCMNDSIISTINSNKTRDRNGVNAVRDVLTVIYLADNPCLPGATSCEGDNNSNIDPQALIYTDCAGGGALRNAQSVSCSTDFSINNNIDDAKIYNTFELVKNRNSPNDRTLMCYGSRGGGQPLVDNMEAIQYLYGVKDEENDGSIAYRTAAQVESEDQWALVRSIQVGLLIRSSDSNLVDKTTARTEYNILGTKVAIADVDLGRLFKIYTTTINLENLDKGPLG